MATSMRYCAGDLRALMPKRALMMIGVMLFLLSTAFADSFTVTTDFTTLAGENEVIFGYAALNASGMEFTNNLAVNLTGPGSFDPFDAADGWQYSYAPFSATDSSGYLGVYLYSGTLAPFTLDFDISTVLSDFSTSGPDYSATYNYAPTAVPEPNIWELLGSELIAGLFWFAIRRRNKERPNFFRV